VKLKVYRGSLRCQSPQDYVLLSDLKEIISAILDPMKDIYSHQSRLEDNCQCWKCVISCLNDVVKE